MKVKNTEGNTIYTFLIFSGFKLAYKPFVNHYESLWNHLGILFYLIKSYLCYYEFRNSVKKVICELHGNQNIKKSNIYFFEKYKETKKYLKENNLLDNWFIEWD